MLAAGVGAETQVGTAGLHSPFWQTRTVLPDTTYPVSHVTVMTTFKDVSEVLANKWLPEILGQLLGPNSDVNITMSWKFF